MGNFNLLIYVFAYNLQDSPGDLPRTQKLSPIPSTPELQPANIVTESQSPLFNPRATVSTSNTTLHTEVAQDSSRHVILNHGGLITDSDQLSSAVHHRTPDESPTSIVLESPQAKLQTGE